MAKTFSVDLPITTARELRYTRVERQEFEKRFRHFGLPGMKEIIFEKVLPIKPNPADDNKLVPTGGGDYEAQVALIWMGIRHNAKHLITEEWVADKLEVAIKEGRPQILFVIDAVNAVLASGVLGYIYEGRVAEIEEEEVAPATEGKAPDTSTSAA